VSKLQDTVFDYFNIIVKEYTLALDKWHGSDYTQILKENYEKIDKEFEDMELAEEIPEGLTKELSLHLLKEKEERLTSVYQQLQSIQMQESSGVDFDSTILLNRTMFDDKMFIKTGYSGQDL
jgi:hypothetical protein